MLDIFSLAQVDPLAWYQQPWVMLLFVLIVVVAAYFLAQAISRAARTQEHHGWRLWLIFSALGIAAIVVTLKWPPKFGVDLRGGITIIGQLKKDESGEQVDIASQIPRMVARVDPSGTQEILIRPLGTDKIEVTIPDVTIDEAQRIWKRLTQAGHLQFRILADERYHNRLISRGRQLVAAGINDAVVREASPDNPNDNLSGKIIGRWYELGREEKPQGGVLPFRFSPSNTNVVRNGTTKQLIEPAIFADSPVNFARWAEQNNARRIEVLCVEPESPDDRLNVEGKHIASARNTLDERGGPAVHFEMTKEGRVRMGALTSRNQRVNDQAKQLAIISDGKLLSAPEINSTITSQGIIEGRFTDEEVEDLVINLRAGRLEVALHEQPISQDYVESTIGEDLKRKGIFSFALSFVLIGIFMVWYYRFAGIVACCALLFNLLLILFFVMLIKQPLTMTGIAGLVLTVGMSVDANVLIFERMREEMEKGSALRMVIRNGFDRALSAIIDGNVTTLFTAFFLYLFGSEQLKGFAVTLSLGICTSMFTAIFCSRVFFELAERMHWIKSLKMLKLFPSGVIDFVSRRRVFYAISLVLIAIGLFATVARGKRVLDNDLRGGSTARVVLAENVTMNIDEFRRLVGDYQGMILDEPVEFSVSKINSDEFPDRSFKVDSNIPVWEGDGPAPYAQIEQALGEIFGDKLMQTDVDVGKITIDKVETAPAGGTPPTNSDVGKSTDASPGEKQVGRSTGAPNSLDRLAWAWLPLSRSLPIALIGSSLGHSGDVAFGTDRRQEPDETGKPAEGPPNEPPSSETAPAGTQDTSTQDSPTNPPAQAQEKPAETGAEKQEDAAVPSAAPQEDAPAGLDDMLKQDPPPAPAGQAPPATVGRYRVTAAVTFHPPVARRSLIDKLVTTAEATNQLTLDPNDITVSAEGIDSEDQGKKSGNWTVSIVVPREADGQVVLDRLKADNDGKPYFQTISGVGGQIASRTQFQALGAMLGSLLVVIAYIWFRFQNVEFGLAAVVALVHDVLVTLGAIALSYYLAPALGFLQVENFRISLPVIAAFLTLIGYSLNDTIVIFDRIREVRGKRTEFTAEMMNVAISQTLSRTILTAGTTLLVIVILYFLGGESIHAFCFALMVGIISGTYSTIFIACPILLWLMNRRPVVAVGKTRS